MGLGLTATGRQMSWKSLGDGLACCWFWSVMEFDGNKNNTSLTSLPGLVSYFDYSKWPLCDKSQSSRVLLCSNISNSVYFKSAGSADAQ